MSHLNKVNQTKLLGSFFQLPIPHAAREKYKQTSSSSATNRFKARVLSTLSSRSGHRSETVTFPEHSVQSSHNCVNAPLISIMNSDGCYSNSDSLKLATSNTIQDASKCFLLTREQALANLKCFYKAVNSNKSIKVEDNTVFISDENNEQESPVEHRSCQLYPETDKIFRALFASIKALEQSGNMDLIIHHVSFIIDIFRTQVVDFETDDRLDVLEKMNQSYR